ncbi:MAG: glycosyltransferase family 4 protein [Gemmatimonadales bacterium]
MPTARAEHDILFAYDFPPMGGGIARWMQAIALGSPPGSLTVSTGTLPGAVASDAALPQRIDRIPVHADRLRTVPGLLAWSRRGVALAREPGARFAWCDTARPAGYPAHWVWRRTGLPYGIMIVGGDLMTLRKRTARSRFKTRIMRRILGDAAALVAISRWTADHTSRLLLELELEAAIAKIRVLPLGTDPARWRRDPDGASSFRRKRGLPEGTWLITVARLVEYKGIDTAIRVVATLSAEHSELHYAVVGRGPDAPRLQALCRELGVADRVHFLDDVSDDELPAAYSMANVYLGLTRETADDVEGFGISFVEAAACGLPVVAARSGGIPDAVQDGETGLLLAPDDVTGVAAAIDRLLRNSDQARGMGDAGREMVENHLNWNRVVDEMREIAAELGRQSSTADLSAC